MRRCERARSALKTQPLPRPHHEEQFMFHGLVNVQFLDAPDEATPFFSQRSAVRHDASVG